MLWGIIIIAIILLDRISKILVVKNMNVGDSFAVISDFFYMTYIENRGAAMGILQNGRVFLIIITLLISTALVYYLYKTEGRVARFSLAMILGGAVGNLLDRIFRGSVIDFLDFRFGSYNFYIFNVADSFVVVGTILLAYYLLFVYKEKAVER